MGIVGTDQPAAALPAGEHFVTRRNLTDP